MAHLYRLILGCLVYLLCLPLFAQIAPTTGTEYRYNVSGCGQSSCVTIWGTPAQACQDARRLFTSGSNLVTSVSGTNCNFSYTRTDGGTQAGTLVPATRQGSICPANSTLAGSVCSCNSGYAQSGNQCVDAQTAICEGLVGQTLYVQVPGRALPGSTVCGSTGCQMTVSGTVIIGKQAGATVTEGDATFSGGPCTADPQTQAAPDTCPNGQPGQVNGVNVCVPYSDQNTLESIKEESEEKNDSESGQEQKTTTKQTICNGNSCTTTTTTTTVTNGGAPKTTTTEKTEAKDDFCTANPKSPQCSSSSFSGSCGSFTCAGDAVQCAIAREQHTRNCQLFSATNQETQQYETSKSETGNRTNAVPITPVAISPGSFDQTPVFGAGACIADLQVTVWGSQLALPLSTICPQLEWLRALLLTISFLLAVRIVSRG